MRGRLPFPRATRTSQRVAMRPQCACWGAFFVWPRSPSFLSILGALAKLSSDNLWSRRVVMLSPGKFSEGIKPGSYLGYRSGPSDHSRPPEYEIFRELAEIQSRVNRKVK